MRSLRNLAGWLVGEFGMDDDHQVGWAEIDGFDQILENWSDDESDRFSEFNVRTGTFTINQDE